MPSNNIATTLMSVASEWYILAICCFTGVSVALEH
jgi:hypothetical protein